SELGRAGASAILDLSHFRVSNFEGGGLTMADSITTQQERLEALLKENRAFPPSDDFRRQANVSDSAIYDRARTDLEAFWAEEAERLDWFKRWDKVLEWKVPWAKWFVGGKLNVTYNCVDRHARSDRRNKAAIIWEGEPGDSRVLTFGMLEREVNRCANGLKSLGVKKGDRVAVYMGWRLNCPSPCSPAPRSGRRTAWSSAAFPPRRCASASTTPRPRSW